MDTFSSKTKRKKRKTRKCLDNLRRRSRSVIGMKCNVSSNINPRNDSALKLNRRLYNKPVTNRLTIEMFPKVVRSETVTRSALELRADYQIHTRATSCQDVQSNSKSHDSVGDYFNEKNMMSGDDVLNGYDCPVNEVSVTDSKSSGSFILFSPLEPTMVMGAAGQAAQEDTVRQSAMTTRSTASVSRSDDERYGYCLYEEFVDEIPGYLKVHVPALIKDDVTQTTRTYLDKMYVRDGHRGGNCSNFTQDGKSNDCESYPKNEPLQENEHLVDIICDSHRFSIKRGNGGSSTRHFSEPCPDSARLSACFRPSGAGNTSVGSAISADPSVDSVISADPSVGSAASAHPSVGSATSAHPSVGSATSAHPSVGSPSFSPHDSPAHAYYPHKLHM